MKPFIIWTLQRTGGTSLRVFLEHALGGVQVLAEPFNINDECGWVTKGWDQRKNQNETQNSLAVALKEKPLMKHTFELRLNGFNLELLNAAISLEYQHIFLGRRDEVARIL